MRSILCLLAGIMLFSGCAGVKFNMTFDRKNSNSYPEKVISGTVSGRSSNPAEFKDVLRALSFEMMDKEVKQEVKE